MKKLFSFLILFLCLAFYFTGHCQMQYNENAESYIIKEKNEKVPGHIEFLYDRLSLKFYSKKDIKAATRKDFYVWFEAAKERDDQQEMLQIEMLPQLGILFTPEGKAKGVVYDPKDLLGYSVDGRVYTNMKIKKLIGSDVFFVYTLYPEDYIKVFLVFNKEQNMSTLSYDYSDYMYLKKGDDEKLVQPGSWLATMSFASKMSDYVSDYPELAAKVKNKEDGYSMNITKMFSDALKGNIALYRIVEEYNAWHKKNF